MAELETTTGLAPFCFEKNAPVPLAEKYPLLPVQNSKLPGIFGNLQIFRFARMRKPTPEGMSGAELESSWSSL